MPCILNGAPYPAVYSFSSLIHRTFRVFDSLAFEKHLHDLGHAVTVFSASKNSAAKYPFVVTAAQQVLRFFEEPAVFGNTYVTLCFLYFVSCSLSVLFISS